jgi:hypothetical protein
MGRGDDFDKGYAFACKMILDAIAALPLSAVLGEGDGSAAGAAPLPSTAEATAALSDDDIVTVCSACLRACCWQGSFMCDASMGAGTVDKTVRELRAGQHGEHEDYWRKK